MILTEFYGLIYGVLNKRAESQQMKKACLKLQGMSVSEIKINIPGDQPPGCAQIGP